MFCLLAGIHFFVVPFVFKVSHSAKQVSTISEHTSFLACGVLATILFKQLQSVSISLKIAERVPQSRMQQQHLQSIAQSLGMVMKLGLKLSN